MRESPSGLPHSFPDRPRRATLPSTLTAAGSLLVMGLSAFAQSYETNDLTPIGQPTGKFAGTSSGKRVGGTQATGSYYTHAIRMHDNALQAEDIHPAAYYYSMATCADDSQEGGWGYALTGGIHALVWTGSTCVDLQPSGYNFSYCLGIRSGKQVGYAQSQSYFVTGSHAFCWYGSAASGVDLHPATTYPYSRATACSDSDEVGYVSLTAWGEGESLGYHINSHAYRWQGSAATGVDLHPAGFDSSEALCSNGTQQGGWGYSALSATKLHALLWSGDAASFVDLHPAGYSESRINALNATQQVGEAWVGVPGAAGSVRHAVAWSGTADSVIDLNQFLPRGYTHGVATGIDADGQIVGYAYNTLQAGVTIPTGAIAVVFAPGQTPPGELSSIVVNPADAAPGDVVSGVVTLGGPAPAGGLPITLATDNTALATAPAAITIPEGQTQATFSLPTGGAALTTTTTFKVYASDGVVSHCFPVKLTPVVKPLSVTVNSVEGGFTTYGTLAVNIPAQAGGATFSLTSGNPTLAAVPATVTLPPGYTSYSFAVSTSSVSAATTVPITATLNGQTLSATLTLSPAPVVALASISIPQIVGGMSTSGTVSVNNFPRTTGGAVVALQSGDSNTLQVPTSVTIPQGAYSATFAVTSSVVTGLKGVSVKASYNGGSLTSTVSVFPPPTVTITQADYLTDTKMFKVQATTTFENSILTYGTDPTGAPLGTMQFELGVFKGSMIMDTPPAYATVWNSNGGMATVPVNIKTSSTGGGGSSSTTTKTSYKITVKTIGKGTVSMSPSAASYAPGTVVTLTATPAAGAVWVGWTGAVTSNSKTISVTVNANTSLNANFK